MKKEKEIRKLIEVYTGIDVFEKNRKQETVDARCLFDSILREHRKYSYQAIADIYKINGFKYASHSSVLHRVNLFDEVLTRKRQYKELMEVIMETTLSSRQINNLLNKTLQIKTQKQFKKVSDYLSKVLSEDEIENEDLHKKPNNEQTSN